MITRVAIQPPQKLIEIEDFIDQVLVAIPSSPTMNVAALQIKNEKYPALVRGR